MFFRLESDDGHDKLQRKGEIIKGVRVCYYDHVRSCLVSLYNQYYETLKDKLAETANGCRHEINPSSV